MPDPSPRRSPVVIVRRRPVPGREAQLRAWLQDVATAARRAPGFVALEMTQDADGADEWTVTYRFRDAESLDAWLSSDTRRELIATGTDLVDGAPTEQRLAVPALQPVTAVSSVLVPPANRARYRAHHERLLRELEDQPGFVAADLLEPVAGVQEETVVVLSFTTREHLDAWLASPVRARMVAELDELAEGDRTVSLVGGFAGWFPPAGQDSVAPRWKTALVVLLALYPTAMALGALQGLLLPDLPGAVATLLGNVAGVAILTWLLMPPLTRALGPWLRR